MLQQIMKEYEHDDCVSYRIGCDCFSNDHDLDIYAEQDEDGHLSTIQFVASMSTPYWDRTFTSPWLEWLNEPIKRIKLITKILFVGRVEYNCEFVLGKDNIVALRYALDEIEKKFT